MWNKKQSKYIYLPKILAGALLKKNICYFLLLIRGLVLGVSYLVYQLKYLFSIKVKRTQCSIIKKWLISCYGNMPLKGTDIILIG